MEGTGKFYICPSGRSYYSTTGPTLNESVFEDNK